MRVAAKSPQSSQARPTPPEGRGEPDRRARLRAALPYRRVEVPGERALAEWERLRAEGRGWPVIVGDDEQLDAIAEQFLEDYASAVPAAADRAAHPTTGSILAEAARLRFPASLATWAGTAPELPEPPLGTWPAKGTVQGSGLTVASDVLSGKPFPIVHILLIPTA